MVIFWLFFVSFMTAAAWSVWTSLEEWWLKLLLVPALMACYALFAVNLDSWVEERVVELSQSQVNKGAK